MELMSQEQQGAPKVKVTREVKRLINQRANTMAQDMARVWAGQMVQRVERGLLGIEQIRDWRP
jgi:hypothetical protein